jgi:tRNA dimethylallyltransferase
MGDNINKWRNQPVLVICGPTASGKTSLAIEVALSGILNAEAEIISADSMQIYRGFDIGTAKASQTERALVPHHMIDICEPEEYFSVAQYKQMATGIIHEIHGRNKLAVICGGTGQYLSALTEGIEFINIPVDNKIRDMLNHKADESGNQHLLNELFSIDPETAIRLSVADRKRIVRALEVYYSSGITMTEINRKSKLSGPDFKFITVCIDTDRKTLYEKIDSRVIDMFNNGWLDEVKSLINMGVSKKCTSMQAIGYRQIISYLNQDTSLEACITDIQRATRRYAKRQITWFRGMKNLNWINYNIFDSDSKRLEFIKNLMR